VSKRGSELKKNLTVLAAFVAFSQIGLFAQQGPGPASAGSSTPVQPSAPSQPTAPRVEQAQAPEHILQDGTPVKLSSLKKLSSANAVSGQEIEFEVLNDLSIDGVTVLRRGTIAKGVVTESQKKRRVGKEGVLNFTIPTVKLADGRDVPVRAFTNTSGDSHNVGVTALAFNMPIVAAPFFLLMHGENSTIPKGTEITVFIRGDIQLDLNRFGASQAPLAEKPSATEMVPGTTPN
jgi:hypothetical protein